MSKSIQSMFMLLFLGIGLGAFGIYQILNGPSSDHVAIGLFYMIPTVVAFVSLLKLPSKQSR